MLKYVITENTEAVALANLEAKTVHEVITKMADDEIVLPVIQRRLVWAEEQMLLLFDSLFLQNSFGSIVCVEEQSGTEPLFSCRPFTKNGSTTDFSRPDKVARTRMFVIDGQQRLQSFYMGLSGTLNGKSLYYDLFSNYHENEYNFAFETSANNLPAVNKDSSAINEHLWCQASLLFTMLTQNSNPRIASESIIAGAGITDINKTKYIEENVRNFYDRIFVDTSIGISKVSARVSRNKIKDRERIAELFRRLNNGGTRLTNYDLVYSSLSGINDNMDSFFDTIETRYLSIGMNKRTIIRLIYVLTDQPTKNEDSMSQAEADFVATKRGRIEKTLEALKKFLDMSNHTSWFRAGGKSLIPLYFLAYHIFNKPCGDDELPHLFDNFDTNNSEFTAMKRWLQLSLLNRTFSYGCGWRANSTGMTQIHKVMKASKGQDFPVNGLFSLYAYRLNRFTRKQHITVNNLALLDEDYLFMMIYGNPKSSLRDEDTDHIHPVSLLEKAGASPDKIDSIGNLQRIDQDTNRNGKRAKEFGEWIKTGVSEENLPCYLEKHLIPKDSSLWYVSKFDEFLREKLRLIADKIKSSL